MGQNSSADWGPICSRRIIGRLREACPVCFNYLSEEHQTNINLFVFMAQAMTLYAPAAHQTFQTFLSCAMHVAFCSVIWSSLQSSLIVSIHRFFGLPRFLVACSLRNRCRPYAILGQALSFILLPIQVSKVSQSLVKA